MKIGSDNRSPPHSIPIFPYRYQVALHHRPPISTSIKHFELRLMSTDKLIIKLRYNKSKRETIEKIANMEIKVARGDVIGGQNARNNKQGNAPPKSPNLGEVLSQLRRILRVGDCDEVAKVMACSEIIKKTLQSLSDSVDTKKGAEGSSGQQQLSANENDDLKGVESQCEDPQLSTAKLLAENKRLEAANNELICDVDKNEAELSELRQEVGRIRDNDRKLEEIRNSLETSRNSTNKALNVLISLKKKDNTHWESVLALKKELKVCKTERDEALTNMERQSESSENEKKTLFDENTKLKGKLANLKRTLDDVDDLEHADSMKKRYVATVF
ncbi:hypothetical protein BCIN_03g08760 [Botrytis cinerea B05.10]|uniref:Uncharacterized protein n=1 Tax=Botryotinia fuckeliana (strain B05.10) TaxID=332648 RepID=A0A384JE17_BOTFB|nr:hypothetical protein BCIN_03g08760 [Botrytis cinerea B05.10]ATZ48691.1 hypothetical protein BCIN_03g08760 [Botrytis cinerea B05.10]